MISLISSENVIKIDLKVMPSYMYTSTSIMSSSAQHTVDYNDWDVNAIRYMQPRVNDRGGRSISIISTQINRVVSVTTPMLMTWGISDYVDPATGESDNKYNIQLAFPLNETPETTSFLDKMKEFEKRIIDDAAKHSEAWFGKARSKEVIAETYYSYLKYPKDKLTKQHDFTKPPSFRPRVPYYDGEWKNLKVYDCSMTEIYPCGDVTNSPVHLVPSRSQVVCLVQCSGVWTAGGNSWGVTWKLAQCVVKPREVSNINDQCHIKLSDDLVNSMNKQVSSNDYDEPEEKPTTVFTTPVADTQVDDSEEEEEEEEEEEPEPEPEPVKPKKKVVTKKAPQPVEEESEAPAPKKVVRKKKATA